jgi:hypothetical protein
VSDKNKTTLKLSELEMEVLLKVLSFANTAAVVVQDLEQKKGKQEDSEKMAAIASDSRELIRIITNQAVKIEERPELLN